MINLTAVSKEFTSLRITIFEQCVNQCMSILKDAIQNQKNRGFLPFAKVEELILKARILQLMPSPVPGKELNVKGIQEIFNVAIEQCLVEDYQKLCLYAFLREGYPFLSRTNKASSTCKTEEARQRNPYHPYYMLLSFKKAVETFRKNGISGLVTPTP